MKRLLLVVICFATICAADAQQVKLALNEHNKYVYYQVIDMPGFSADSLEKNASWFVKSVYPKTKSKADNSGISIKDKFSTYTAITKHESGEIAYTLNIECKDTKYRYWLTDFVFTPYEKNRYGVFVPVNGIEIPLEVTSDRVPQKELDGYLDQTGAFCKQVAEKLKRYMTEGQSTQKQELPTVKKVVTDKW